MKIDKWICTYNSIRQFTRYQRLTHQYSWTWRQKPQAAWQRKENTQNRAKKWHVRIWPRENKNDDWETGILIESIYCASPQLTNSTIVFNPQAKQFGVTSSWTHFKLFKSITQHHQIYHLPQIYIICLKSIICLHTEQRTEILCILLDTIFQDGINQWCARSEQRSNWD